VLFPLGSTLPTGAAKATFKPLHAPLVRAVRVEYVRVRKMLVSEFWSQLLPRLDGLVENARSRTPGRFFGRVTCLWLGCFCGVFGEASFVDRFRH
jgi:hypothetical protein